MLIVAAGQFSQAVCLADEVSEPNKNALCCLQLCAAHLHRQHQAALWRVDGYLGNLFMKYTVYPYILWVPQMMSGS